MRPAWSVVVFTTLAGAGQGLFLAILAADLLLLADRRLLLAGCALTLLLLAAGLAASFLHLGHPERAWRAMAMWRTSWLSREVIVLPAFMGMVFLYAVLCFKESDRTLVLAAGLAAAILCLALFICTGMIYACLKFLQEWHTPLTLINFAMLGTASGLTAASALTGWLQPSLAGAYAAAALIAGAIAYALRLAALARNAKLRPRSTLASAIGIKHPKIVQIAQGAMGGSFNTREFFHGRPRETVLAVRWTFLALLFPAPALLLASGAQSAVILGAAFVLQFAGLLAERWYFFAEAKHPQNLYYQAIA